jgi:hypothetical protein
VAFLSVTGLILRLAIVRGPALEEAAGGVTARDSLSVLVHSLSHATQPPLYPIVLWLVAHTVGSGPLDLRLPSIAFGTLTIPMLFVAGRTLYGVAAGIVAAALGTVGPLAVWYSQDIGPYALVMLLVTVTIWAQRRALATDQARFWLAWAASAAALFWSEWTAALFVLVEILTFLPALDSRRCDALGRRRARRNLALAVIGVVLACEAGVALLITQLRNSHVFGLGSNGPPPAAVSPAGVWTNMLWAGLGYHSSGAIDLLAKTWPLAALGVAYLVVRRNRDPARRLLLALALAPLLIVAVAARDGHPSLLEVRFVIGAAPVLCLLGAGLTWTLASHVRARRTAVTVLLVVSTIALVLQQTDSRAPQLSGYAAAFGHIASTGRAGDEILYAPVTLLPAVEYFAPGTRRAELDAGTASGATADPIFVVVSPALVGSDPAAVARQLSTLERARHLVSVLRAPGVTVWQFTPRPSQIRRTG